MRAKSARYIPTRKWLAAFSVHLTLALLWPLNGWIWAKGVGAWQLWPLFSFIFCAGLFYSADLFEGDSWIRYGKSLALQALVCSSLGPVAARFGLNEFLIHNGTCLPDGGPILFAFPAMDISLYVSGIPFTVGFILLRCLSNWLEDQGMKRQRRRFQNNLRLRTSLPDSAKQARNLP